jgi:hypothetical protein
MRRCRGEVQWDSLEPSLDLFFTFDGVTPIAWDGSDYIDMCFIYDGQRLEGISDVTTYMSTAYPSATLDSSNGHWLDPVSSGPLLSIDCQVAIEFTTNGAGQIAKFPVYTPTATPPSYTIRWGDGTAIETTSTNYPEHTYSSAGTYVAKLCTTTARDIAVPSSTSTFPQLYRDRITGIINWGRSGAQYTHFQRCNNITTIDPRLDPTITSMSSFAEYSSLAISDLSNLDVSNVTDFSWCFSENTGDLPSLNSWDTSNATDMDSMFSYTTIANPSIASWDTSNVVCMSDMFSETGLFNPDVSNWDVSSVEEFDYMFAWAASANPDTTLWDTSSALDMEGMFYSNPVAQPSTRNWDVSNVTTMSYMFSDTALANPDTELWDTGACIDMEFMFDQALSAQPSTRDWDVSLVESFYGTFANTLLANPDTELWDTSSCYEMRRMFYNAVSATPSTRNWDVSGVYYMYETFAGAISANPDVELWDVGLVNTFYGMFNGATSANPDVSGWVFPNATNLQSMFEGATLATPDVSSWDVSGIEQFSRLFYNATNANPDMSAWVVTSATGMNTMLDGSGCSTANYSNFLIQVGVPASPSGILLTANGISYDGTAASARSYLTGTKLWTIFDGGPAPAPDVIMPEMSFTVKEKSSVPVVKTPKSYVSRVSVNNKTSNPIKKHERKLKTLTPTGRSSSTMKGPLFFSYDGVNPVPWNNNDYVDLRMLVNNELLSGIDDVTKYMAKHYPNAELISATGEWHDDIHAGPIKAIDVALTFELFALEGQEINLPIVLQKDGGVFVDWDDSTELIIADYPTHVYDKQGIHVVKVYSNTVKHIGYYVNSGLLTSHVLKVINWGRTGATSASFPNVNSIVYIDPKFDPTITDISYFLAYNNASLVNLDDLDVSNVQNFSFAFSNNKVFDNRLTKWDTSSATNFSGMFMNAESAQPDVRFWDTSNVTSFKSMFENAYEAIPDVRKWNMSNARTIKNMFRNAVNARPMTSSWTTHNLLEMRGFVEGAIVANPDMASWDISNVADMDVEELEMIGVQHAETV